MIAAQVLGRSLLADLIAPAADRAETAPRDGATGATLDLDAADAGKLDVRRAGGAQLDAARAGQGDGRVRGLEAVQVHIARPAQRRAGLLRAACGADIAGAAEREVGIGDAQLADVEVARAA